MQNTQTKLENAARGLLMMSESDYPFDYFSTTAKVIDESLVLGLAGKLQGATIENISIDQLLRNLTDTAWGSVSPADAQKFSNLSAVLKQELAGITVYRVGDVQIDVFILGTTADGTVAGMRTKLIET
jgi:hypothetical protein